MRQVLVPIALFTMITLITIGRPLVRALAKRIEGGATPPVDPEAAARLERMEHAIEAMALEVERIAEGQRFTTKLLSERGGTGAGMPAARGMAEPPLRATMALGENGR
jgi:hypothetical protein